MKKHFVKFYSAGTFVAEESVKQVDSWDVDKAVAMSKDITERYGAKPYGFRFITRGRTDKDLDSKIVAESGMYFINGVVETLDEIKAVVMKNFDKSVEFIEVPEAEQYRTSLKMKESK